MTAVGDAAEFARPGEAIYQAAQYLEKKRGARTIRHRAEVITASLRRRLAGQ